MSLALEVRGLGKRYGGQRALDGVSLDLRRGEIHALLGENGAGKSTLIKILAGAVARDEGEIEAGTRLAFVHQDLGLVEDLSVAENLALELGYARRRGLISFAATRRRAAELLAGLSVDVSADAIVGELAQDQKVMVAVTRAVSKGAGAIVLDEVSSSLPAPEMRRLADALRAAKRSGVAYLFVTHRLEEVFELADRVTVLRDGRRVATADVAEIDHERLVAWILGEAAGAPVAAGAGSVGEVRLRVSGPQSFDVAAGEVLGVCGLIGSGARDVARLLGGACASVATATLDGRSLPLGDPAALARAGVAYVPGDRNREGAVAELSVRENLFLARRPWRRERALADSLVARFDVRGVVEAPLSTLSGGNQQKVIFARALHRRPALLVLDDPTAGVDVGSRAQLHGYLRECAAGGAAVVLASTDFEEVASQADRVLVMRHGRIERELRGAGADALARAAYGTVEEEVAA